MLDVAFWIHDVDVVVVAAVVKFVLVVSCNCGACRRRITASI